MNAAQNGAFSKSFGSFIRNGRLEKKLSQTDVAKHLGLTQSYYAYIELGHRNVDLSLAMRICDYLELDLGEFIRQYPDK